MHSLKIENMMNKPYSSEDNSSALQLIFVDCINLQWIDVNTKHHFLKKRSRERKRHTWSGSATLAGAVNAASAAAFAPVFST